MFTGDLPDDGEPALQPIEQVPPDRVQPGEAARVGDSGRAESRRVLCPESHPTNTIWGDALVS